MTRNEERKTSAKGGRVLIVELWRFIFSLGIISWHYLWHNYGIDLGLYITVDIFLILSGFLMYRQLSRRNFSYEGAWAITWKRASGMWPVYAFGCFSVLVSQCLFRDGMGFGGLVREILYGIPEFFYLTYAGNGVAWYVQRMLVAGLVVMFLLCVNRKAYTYCIAPLGIWFLYWTMYQKLGGIQNFDSYTFTQLIQDTQFRALAGLMLGTTAAALLEHIQSAGPTLAGKLLQRRGNLLGCIGIALGLSLMMIKQYGLFELISIAIFFFSVLGLFGGRDFTEALAPYEKPIGYLGTLSFSLYINQYNFDWIALPYGPAASLAIILAVNLVYAVVTRWAIEGICRFVKKRAAAAAAL